MRHDRMSWTGLRLLTVSADSSEVPAPDMFTFDGNPQQRRIKCPSCTQEHEGVTGFVLRGGSAYAVYFADWYPTQARRGLTSC